MVIVYSINVNCPENFVIKAFSLFFSVEKDFSVDKLKVQ